MIRRRLGFGALLVVLFVAGWVFGWSRATARDRYEKLDLFVDALSKVESYYVDPVDPQKLVTGAINGMMKRLDPFSNYLDAKSFDELTVQTQGQFGGLGIVVSVRDNVPTVISVLEGTPAASLGILPGDRIVEIEGKSTRGFAIDEVVSKLRGPENTKVTIQVQGVDESTPRTVTVTRRIIHVKSIPYTNLFPGNVGYIRLSSFSATSGDELTDALNALQAQGAKGIVLDLRGNPGGLLSEAVDVSERFLPKGAVVVQTRGRAPNSDQTFYAEETRPNLSQPIVVLVDEFTASAAEIVSGALQDHDRALVVGEPTYGKGSVQSLLNLPGSKAALKLTTAKYYTPSGRSIHKDAYNAHLGEEVSSEDDDEEGTPPSDTTSNASKPKFKTDSGRIVYGGGGITPDVTIHPDTLSNPSLEIERRALLFQFANHYVASHPGITLDQATAQAGLWTAFNSYLTEQKFKVAPDSLEMQKTYLNMGVRREIARRLGGDQAAFRVASEQDVMLQKALDLVRRARAPRELLKLSMLH
jgi:carboxyl-terminal processing protease